MTMPTLRSAFVETPIGILQISASERGLVSLAFTDPHPSVSLPPQGEGRTGGGSNRSHPSADNSETSVEPVLEEAARQIKEYFSGARRDFADLPLAIAGSSFSQDVWEQVRRVPYGSTLTYGQIAASLRKEGAARAVGRAVGANPLCIIIPCHRILPSDGSLGGFAWGTERKKWLLELENISVR
ncbi:MAG: methylated-DNA--[protein]-cysteine S-methyltransferase [Candidatus Peribacteraceae bacterium]|nr:methylated-DNA--[protein]-cysteine S-methyltransferase [Candidatus Peribacteraceae bacterium]